MPIHKPEEVLEVVTQAFNAGNVDAYMAVYEPEAYFILSRGNSPLLVFRPSGKPSLASWQRGQP
jgi:hypothetical protein